MPRPIAPFHRCLESEKLLELPCIKELPTEHKPAEKWTAARLKLPHETRSRILPSVRRKLKKNGGVLGEEKEVWMLKVPSADELKSNNLGRDYPTNQGAKDDINHAEKISEISAADRRTSKGFVAATTPVWPVAKGE